MQEVLATKFYSFPYTNLHFAGMNSGEKILFVTRESVTMLRLRLFYLGITILMLIGMGTSFIRILIPYSSFFSLVELPFILLCAVVFIGAFWWISETYRKSVFIITTRRLTKIIYTTPFTWYQFSLGLDEIADTGSYSSTYFEALFHLGYFVARSGAAAVKNFKIVNITFSADLHNYVNKLLYAFKHHQEKIDTFRPFIPHLKGERRKEYLKNYEEFKTEF